MKKILLLVIILSMLAASGCAVNNGSEKSTIAVGIPPLAGFVEKVAGDDFTIVTLVPPGNSPANYQPTAKEMQQLSDAGIYFTLQMPTEVANILPKAADFNKDLNIIYLRDEVSLVYPLLEAEGHSHDEDEHDEDEHDEDEHDEDEHDEDHDHGDLTVDPHLWLSPKRAIEMVNIITRELSELNPGSKDEYEANAGAFIAELEDLDARIKVIVSNMTIKSFMMYHGAYSYFADDYGLEMITLEASGKQASASDIQEVIDHAVEEGIKVVFYQDEFDDNQAKTVAEEIGGRVEKSSPLSTNYIESLDAFAKVLEIQGD